MSLVPKPFHELLKMHFIIPPYQRGYRWESRQAVNRTIVFSPLQW